MARPKIYFLLLLLILIIAGFLRLYQIKTAPPGLYPDEAIGGNQGLQALRTGDFKVFYPENNGREGLFINIQGLSEGIFGANKPWASRLPSAVFGILTVLGIYFLAKELFNDEISFFPKPRSQSGLVSDSKSDQTGEDKQASRCLPATRLRSRRWQAGSERSGLRKNEILALLSAFLLATNFWHINFSRIGFSAVLAPFFLVWSVYFLLKALNSQNSIYYLLPTTYSVIAGIFYGLGFHSYIPYRVTPLLILFILIYYWRRSKRENSPSFVRPGRTTAGRQKQLLLTACYFLLAAFIVALPIGIYFLAHPADFSQRASEISVFSSKTPLKDLRLNTVKTLGMFNFRGDGNWRHNYPGRPELFWPVGVLFILGIIVGIKSITSTKHEVLNPEQILNSNDSNPKRFGISSFGNWDLFRNSKLGFSILFLWFILAALPAIISNEGLPHALRSILMIPPAILLAGIGGVAAYDFLKKRITGFWLPLASTIFLFLLVFEAYNTYFVLWAKNSNVYGAFSADYVELGRTLNELPANVPKYIIVKARGVLVNGPPAMTPARLASQREAGRSSGDLPDKTSSSRSQAGVGRGIPMPAQTVMFITDTFSPEHQRAKNIHYVLPDQENTVPSEAKKFYIE